MSVTINRRTILRLMVCFVMIGITPLLACLPKSFVQACLVKENYDGALHSFQDVHDANRGGVGLSSTAIFGKNAE